MGGFPHTTRKEGMRNMGFQCPKCGQLYMMDKDQQEMTFRCPCKTVLGIDFPRGIDNTPRVSASMVVDVFQEIPSYTKIRPVGSMPTVGPQQ